MEIREIIGNTTATPNPRPDWAQTDETKADYIKNKPDINGMIDDANKAVLDEVHETYVNKEEIIDVKHGGTGATTAKEARENLGITPANIGAAPAGFGLGTEVTPAPNNDANEIIETGFYSASTNVPGSGTWIIQHYNLLKSDDYALQIAESFNHAIVARAERKKIDGTWQAWEWVTPLLNVDVEYRTTERMNSKAVYKKRLKSGAIQYRLDGETEWKDYAPVFGAAPASHAQSASTITAGTFAGQVVSNGSAQDSGTMLLRNSKLVTTDTNPTNNGEICWVYE